MGTTKYTRRGHATTLNIDKDARLLLEAMAHHRRSMGSLISELIRAEAERRVQRPDWLQTLKEVPRD
jgi:hypothetical protein